MRSTLRSSRIVAAVVLVLALTSCATGTPAKPATPLGPVATLDLHYGVLIDAAMATRVAVLQGLEVARKSGKLTPAGEQRIVKVGDHSRELFDIAQKTLNAIAEGRATGSSPTLDVAAAQQALAELLSLAAEFGVTP